MGFFDYLGRVGYMDEYPVWYLEPSASEPAVPLERAPYAVGQPDAIPRVKWVPLALWLASMGLPVGWDGTWGWQLGLLSFYPLMWFFCLSCPFWERCRMSSCWWGQSSCSSDGIRAPRSPVA